MQRLSHASGNGDQRYPRLRRLRSRLRAALNVLTAKLTGIPSVTPGKITHELIRACIRSAKPVVIEIGCNDGTNTLEFVEMFPDGRIYCFEPDPRPIARFKANIKDTPNVALFDLAISDHNGTTEFFQSAGKGPGHDGPVLPDGWDASGSIRQPKLHLTAYPDVTFERSIVVKTMTLDSWCATHDVDAIDFIWMDVQGAELDVFAGARKSLSKSRYVYTEYSNAELYKGQGNLRAILSELKDFRIAVRFAGDVLLYNSTLTEPPDALLLASIG
jgi:2-O-methyltransferase